MGEAQTQLSSGSEWRKVDIHVHTPASHDYHSKGTTYQEIVDAINGSDADIIAITDHWTLDGYKALKPLISADKVLLPGIEIKLDKNTKGKSGAKGGFHAQVIFPENTDTDDIEDKFLKQLQLCEHDGKLPTRKDIIELGGTLVKEGASEDDRWEKGCQQAYVDFKSVTQKAHQLGGLVVIPYDRHGGYEDIDPIGESVLKSDILKGTDVIETLDEDVRKAHMENPAILKAVGKKTPAFKSSDAHELGELGRAYTWVKGEKSFEGMRQALYFPDERVSFDDAKPTYHYPRISSIKLTNANGGHALTSINNIEIPLNENLTTIIGHPSIGKSTMVEAVAYLFDEETTDEIGEDVSKVENLQELNFKLKIEAAISVGESVNKLSRTFEGVYGGDITVQEVPVTYLNQGYIDRTARDPKKVEQLITDRMDTSALEVAANQVQDILKKLTGHRNAFMERAKLLAKQADTDKRLAAANKFFEISKSEAYLTLQERRKVLSEKHTKMTTAIEGISGLIEVFEAYEEDFGEIAVDAAVIKEQFPSVDVSKLKGIQGFPKTAVQYLSILKSGMEKSQELKDIDKESAHLSTDIKELFSKEKITYTQTMWDEKVKEVQLLEGLQRTGETALAVSTSNAADFMGLMTQLKVNVAKRDQAREASMSSFNEGLKNVEVRYEPSNSDDWLVKVLTDEVKDVWDTYTPADEKEENKFRKPAEEDIRAMIQQLKDTDKSSDEVRQFLIECLEGGNPPVAQDYEYVKWLFGNKSDVIKDFLRLRLREYVISGQLGLYYDGKNIAKEGLSYTERCGALLEIILEKGIEPIIIDQPEDNLGSTYITSTLIPTILRKKHSRQIILISHNPNTVVLSDSDLVVAFDRDEEGEGIELHTGAIESSEIKAIICDIIEGGVDAFKVRSERYKLD